MKRVPTVQPVPQRRGILFPLLVVLFVVGAIAYAINDPVGAANAVKTFMSSLVTFFETLTA